MAEAPIHYTIKGSPHRWLIYRTEEAEDSDRKGPLCLLVADLPAGEQHVFDVVSMYLSDPKLSTPSRPKATAELGGVFVFTDITAKGGRVEAVAQIFGPESRRGEPAAAATATFPIPEAVQGDA